VEREATRSDPDNSRGKLAVVLTGSAARGAAHIGALQALEEVGLRPQVIVGVSAGALIGALYAACDQEACQVKEKYYALAAEKSWQDLSDIDFQGLLRGWTQPGEVQGVLRGQVLFDLLRHHTPIQGKGFQHIGLDLYILAVDLNSGQEVVFSRYTQEEHPWGEGSPPFRLFARGAQDLERVNIATAVQASCATPLLFQPVALDSLSLVEGSLREGYALRLAASLPEVTDILWVNLGYAGRIRDDFNRQSLFAIAFQAFSIASRDQFDLHTSDPLFAGKHVRIVNPGLFNIVPAEIGKTQEMVESARRTFREILGCPAAQSDGQVSREALFGGNGDIWRLALTPPERWQVEASVGGHDLIAILDCQSPAFKEMSWEFDEYLEQVHEEKLQEALPIGVSEWAWSEAQKSLRGRLVWFFFANFIKSGWALVRRGLAWVCQNLGLRKGLEALGQVVAKGLLALLNLGQGGFKAAWEKLRSPR
jgi:predicted acylesterase/phospholipase RssA